jgi:hypothetical protein
MAAKNAFSFSWATDLLLLRLHYSLVIIERAHIWKVDYSVVFFCSCITHHVTTTVFALTGWVLSERRERRRRGGGDDDGQYKRTTQLTNIRTQRGKKILFTSWPLLFRDGGGGRLRAVKILSVRFAVCVCSRHSRHHVFPLLSFYERRRLNRINNILYRLAIVRGSNFYTKRGARFLT